METDNIETNTSTQHTSQNKWYAPLTTPTPLSHVLTLILLVVLPVIGFFKGVGYVQNVPEKCDPQIDLPQPLLSITDDSVLIENMEGNEPPKYQVGDSVDLNVEITTWEAETGGGENTYYTIGMVPITLDEGDIRFTIGGLGEEAVSCVEQSLSRGDTARLTGVIEGLVLGYTYGLSCRHEETSLRSIDPSTEIQSNSELRNSDLDSI
jgi:hypothetical protein